MSYTIHKRSVYHNFSKNQLSNQFYNAISNSTYLNAFKHLVPMHESLHFAGVTRGIRGRRWRPCSPRQVDGRNVPYTSMDYMKKKKISFHALERFFHSSLTNQSSYWSGYTATSIAHISIIFSNRYIGAHERSSDHKLCHNCHRKTNQISRYTQRHLIHLSRVI